MEPLRNVTLELLDAGELALGIGLRQARGVDVGRIMKTCGFDWLFVDTEHNSMSVDTAVQISVAAGTPESHRSSGCRGSSTTTPPAFLTAAPKGSSSPTSIPPSRPSASSPTASIRRLPPLGDRRPAANRLSVDSCRRCGRGHQRGDPGRGHGGDAGRRRQRRGHRHRARNQRRAHRHQRPQHGDGHSRPDRRRPDHRRLRTGHRGVQENGVHVGMGGISNLDHMGRYIAWGRDSCLATSDIAMMMKAAKEQSAQVRALLPG